MEEAIKIIFGGVFSFGAVGTVIVYLMKKYADGFAEKLQKKYAFEFDKEIEKLKSSLEGKNYITKKQFDVEFDIYRDLSKKYFDMLSNLNALFATDLTEKNYHFKKSQEEVFELCESACESVFVANNYLNENRAFVQKDLFCKYDTILNIAKEIIEEYTVQFSIGLKSSDLPRKTIRNDEWNEKMHENVIDLFEKLEDLNNELQEYLYSLKIID